MKENSSFPDKSSVSETFYLWNYGYMRIVRQNLIYHFHQRPKGEWEQFVPITVIYHASFLSIARVTF